MKNIYWKEEQENAVRMYLEMEPGSSNADRLFATKIYGPLKKIVENILYTYHLNVNEESIQDQVDDTISFIATKFRKFEPKQKHKAFSYYGTIAKNYLIMKKNNSFKNINKMENIENLIGIEFNSKLYEDSDLDKYNNSYLFLFSSVISDIENLVNNDLSLPKNVYKVSEVIVFLLKNYQKINVQNKKQFYFLAREFTGLNAKEITKAMFYLKELYFITKKSI